MNSTKKTHKKRLIAQILCCEWYIFKYLGKKQNKRKIIGKIHKRRFSFLLFFFLCTHLSIYVYTGKNNDIHLITYNMTIIKKKKNISGNPTSYLSPNFVYIKAFVNTSISCTYKTFQNPTIYTPYIDFGL